MPQIPVEAAVFADSGGFFTGSFFAGLLFIG
jgi:hypothetical protein